MSLSVALLGAGLFATEAHLPALVDLQAIITLRAIYSHTLNSAAALAKLAQERLHLPSPPTVYHDADPSANLSVLLASRNDIQAVIIALPITVQPDIIRQCLAAGKHVLSEKPVAPSVKEGELLIHEYETKYKNRPLVWRVAENFEAEPAYQRVGDLIRSGTIGKVGWWTLSSIGALGKDSKWYKTPWRTVPEYQGGFLLDGGVHSAAVLRTALPSHPIALSGYVSLTQPHLAPEDTFTVVAQCSDGSHGLFELGEGGPGPSRRTKFFKVTGEDGWIDIDLQGDSFVIIVKKVKRNDKGIVVGEEEEKLVMKSEGVKKEVEAFVEAVVEGGEAGGLGDPREALRDVAFIEAGLKSKGEKIVL